MYTSSNFFIPGVTPLGRLMDQGVIDQGTLVQVPRTDYMYLAQENAGFALAGAAISYLSAGERKPNIRELGAGALAGVGVANVARLVVSGPGDGVLRIVPAVAGTALAAYVSGLIG